MLSQKLLASYKKINSNRIIFVVIDGLGGLRHPEFDNKSELEFANLPELDRLVRAKETILGKIYPVARGIIPGSAAGHLGLFGYDPLRKEHCIGRGILEALGLERPTGAGEDDVARQIGGGDVVARLNLVTVRDGVVVDRRAGRSDAAPALRELDEGVKLNGAKARFFATRGHRGVLFLHCEGETLSANISATDPGEDGKPMLRCEPENPRAQRTAELVNSVVDQASKILCGRETGNHIVVRGFSMRPSLQTIAEFHGLEAVGIADYPLYRGIAKLLGMKVLASVETLEEKVEQLREIYEKNTFFCLHYKTPDSMGEDGNFLGKVKALEDFDRVLPEILDIMNREKDVLVITGDHSTPSILKAHSHHSVPVLLYSTQNKGYDDSEAFSERECAHGAFGSILGVELMPCLLARAGKLKKYDL